MSHDHLPQITDLVRALSDGSRHRITAFYRHHTDSGTNIFGAYERRWLIPCDSGNPDLALIGTTSVCGLFFRPWEVSWEGYVSWSADMIAEERRAYAERVGEMDFVHGLRDSDQPGLFARYPDLTAHGRLKVAQWRADVARAISHHEAQRQEA